MPLNSLQDDIRRAVIAIYKAIEAFQRATIKMPTANQSIRIHANTRSLFLVPKLLWNIVNE